MIKFRIASLNLTYNSTANKFLSAMIFGIAALGLLSATKASFLLVSDSLYPLVLLDGPLLSFRTPPSSYLFPDVFILYAVQNFVSDPLDQMFVSGCVLLLAIFSSTWLYAGGFAAIAVLGLVLAIEPAIALQIGFHLGLIVLAVIYLSSRHEGLRVAVALVATASDPLFAMLLLLITIFDKEGDRQLRWPEFAAVGAGLLIALILNESSIQLVKLSVLMSILIPCYIIMNRVRKLKELILRYNLLFLILTIALLLAISAFKISDLIPEFVPDRYVVPVLAVLIIILLRGRSSIHPLVPSLYAATVAGLIGSATMIQNDPHGVTAFTQRWNCLAREVEAREIKVVAADYLIAKPFYVASRANHYDIGVAQVDFRNNVANTWIAPYSFFNEGSNVAIRDEQLCGGYENGSEGCERENSNLPRVLMSERVCENFTISYYGQKVPAPDHTEPVNLNKFRSLEYSLSDNYKKLTGERSR
jgi:hypothetical protein